MDMLLLCQEVFDELDLKAKSRNISLHLQQNGHPQILVYADRNRIKQVLINLIDNAIKYGNENDNIWVALLNGKRKLMVSVTDDGPGIAKEHQNRIFERFYRIDKSRSRDSGGSGLGLAISKHIIEGHRSTIVVNSELGKGTSLQFKLSKPKV